MTDATLQETMPPRFRGQVLKRVYRVWLFRRLLPVLIAEIAILAFVLYALAKIIFVQRVLGNSLNVLFTRPQGILSFAVQAFLHAPVETEVLAFGVMVLAALLLRHLTQGLLRFILVKENYFAKAGK
ncbi:MAG: hypothetical protein HY221_00105 [Candidatus Sungbacteria bacterium]|uniref:Uncharacterized protein n=1 Tax=Candidatus Sungiibacteriota bacterium TaxID=2750080 RepID=A0A932VPC7_9BACT|nr:hypothetical protein [Candidatus Sungbacteria bacterium]